MTLQVSWTIVWPENCPLGWYYWLLWFDLQVGIHILNFLKNLLLFIYPSICLICGCTCHYMHVEIREQLLTIGSFLPSCGPWVLNSRSSIYLLLPLYESKPTNQINKIVISFFSRIIVIHSFSSSVICPCWSWFDVFESEKLCRESQYPELEGIVKAQVDVTGNLLWGFWASSSTWTTITSMFSCTPSPGLPGLWIGP